MSEFDPNAYKQKQKETWTRNAARYHDSFVSPQAGPFQAPSTLVRLAAVQPGQHVLDVATGTGSVLIELAPAVGPQGRVLGVDLSQGMLSLAQERLAHAPWVEVAEMDAESLAFDKDFDAVTCQFGLMFFPDCQAALGGMRNALKPRGRLALAVHGRPERAPFFTGVMDSARAFFPQLREQKEPGPMRFSNPDKLAGEVTAAGFESVEQLFQLYDIHFSDVDHYLDVFFGTSPKAFVDLVKGLEPSRSEAFFQDIGQRVSPYQTPEGLVLPWEVHFLAARKPG